MEISLILKHPLFDNMMKTLFVTVTIFALRRMIANRMIIEKEIDQASKRKWMVALKNISFFLWLFIVFVIWIQQLQAIGATVVVFAAAIVVATKEFILNIVGYLYRSGSKAFSIGDRIEVNSIRGDVIDQNLTGVTLLEVGSGVKTHQYTGSSVFVPNAVFLSAMVKNETIMGGDYVFHIITLNLKIDDDWQFAEGKLLEAANHVCKPFLQQAIRHMIYLSRKHGLDQPGVEPRINIQIPDHEKVTLQLRVPVPAKRRGRIEADILRVYLVSMTKIKKMKNSEADRQLKEHSDDKGALPEPASS
jgi:small-conductance mechanosensitive channel